jgi:hypothetical protein
MLTEDQLADRLRKQLRHELAAIEPRTELLDGLRRRQARRTVATRISLVAVPVAAAAAAVTMVVTSGGSVVVSPHSKPKGPVVFTAAMVKRVVSESRSAMAHSGQATISYRMTDNGKLNGQGADRITFAGKNWNDVIFEAGEGNKGQWAHTPIAINRIVNGQFYLWIEGPDNKMRWYHDTNPSGHPDVQIPDPRTLFALMNPSARFEVVGHQLVGGVKLTKLRATMAPGIKPLSWLPGIDSGAKVDSLIVWVDGHQVVRQMSMHVRETTTSMPLYLKKFKDGSLQVVVPSKKFLAEAHAMAQKLSKHYHVTVAIDPKVASKIRHDALTTTVSVKYGGFGQRQVITAPKHSTPQFSRG